MRPRERAHLLNCVLLLLALWMVARVSGWLGPSSELRVVPELFYPAVLLITAWGIARLARRRARPRDNATRRSQQERVASRQLAEGAVMGRSSPARATSGDAPGVHASAQHQGATDPAAINRQGLSP